MSCSAGAWNRKAILQLTGMFALYSDLPVSTSSHSVLWMQESIYYLSPVPKKSNSELCLNGQNSKIYSQLKSMTSFIDCIKGALIKVYYYTALKFKCDWLIPPYYYLKYLPSVHFLFTWSLWTFFHSIKKWRSFRTWFPWCPCCRCLRCFCWVTVSQQTTKPINRRTKR